MSKKNVWGGLASLVLAAAVLAGGYIPTPTAHAEERLNAGLQVLTPSRVGTGRKVTLGLNKSLVVELPADVRDILVANPLVADAIVRTSRKIFLIGNQVGQTNIFMFDEAGNTVFSVDLKVERDIGPLEELIEKYVPGSDVTVDIANDNIVLTGTVPNPLAASRAADLATAFVTGGEATTGQFTQTAVSGANGGDSVISNPDAFGRATSQIINLLAIEGEDQVHLKVVVAEIRRSVLKQLGLDFSSGAFSIGNFDFNQIARTANVGASSFLQGGALSAVFSDPFNSGAIATIQALEQAEVLRTLAEPTLTAQSGREASFLVGGEIPVVREVDDDGGIIQEFRPLGVSLNFTPVVQSPERISISVATEVSSIDNTLGTTVSALPSAAGGVFDGFAVGTPAIAVRRASSTIELPSGGSMVLGGLIQDEFRQQAEGIPYLKNLPILGSLFGSNSFERNETELVVIVTPYLVRPTARKNLTRPDKNYAINKDPVNFFFNRLNRLYGGGAEDLDGQKYHGNVGFIFK